MGPPEGRTETQRTYSSKPISLCWPRTPRLDVCASDLGIASHTVREIVHSVRHKAQSCEAADVIARTHLAEIDRKIGDLAALRTELDCVFEIKTVTFRKGNAN
ncbi:MAG: MerR family DNA-binding protein [Sphingopyxis sp.]|nr:MerR family DNA-binding protein [Sphingopyxis sp.]